MADINFNIYDVVVGKNGDEDVKLNIELTTEQRIVDNTNKPKPVKKDLEMTNVGNEKQKYSLTLVNIQFTKKMYQPTEIDAEIAVTSADAWQPVTPEVIETLFKNRKVSVEEVQTNMKVGEDFYVHTVQAIYKSNYMRIYLRVFSLDKLLTLDNTCRTFVGQKLKAGILASELPSDAEKSKYVAPYDPNKALAFDASSMKNLSYDYGKEKSEHIFPYLVQYNESFYDMLARTTNRWGEFMFYENGKLNIGCPNSTAVKLPMTKKQFDDQAKVKDSIQYPLFKTMSFYDVDGQEKGGSNYDCAASYDDNMLLSPLREDPKKVSGNLFCWGGKVDKVVMKKFASFFKNDKNLPTFLGNELFNDLYDLGKQELSVYLGNKKRKDTFFKDTSKAKEQYGEYNFGTKDKEDKAQGYNPFSEIKTVYDKAKYFGILKNEIGAGKKALCIDFSTSYPCLKLGQIISVYDKEYIVTQIDLTSTQPLRLKNDLWVMSSGTPEYSFQVYAIAKQGDQFYPTVIPAGHVRLAEPQMATVTDAGDPNDAGRVRVMFGWQDIKKDSDKKITDETKAASSPWLQFTANAGGKNGIMGMHYEGDTVFVGFVDGNVERPYVLGALSKGAGADIHCNTPGGHTLKIEDNSAGINAFLTGMFTPIYGTLSDFIPAVADFNPFAGDKNNLSLAGGFTLTDNYGIYKISGSTDGRNVSIASPWGDVSINAFTGISISAPNGDISIKGKNVSIEAGNNLSLVSGKNVKYKLWQEKDTRKGSAAQFLLDISAAVAKKLTEKVVNIVDLSIVRSVVEVVLRPVEGKLTVKSNRYLMLEAGKSECKYPEAAYARPEDIQKKLDNKAKNDILAGAGVGTLTNVGKGMVGLFGSISSIIDQIDHSYLERYNRLPVRRARLEEELEDLAEWRNSIKNPDAMIMNKKFDDWFSQDVAPKLWEKKDNFEEFKEDIFGFTDEVAVEGNLDDIVKPDCHNDHSLRKSITSMSFFGAKHARVVDEGIVAKRKELRAKCLKTLNKIGKSAWELQHFYMDKASVGKKLSWFAFTAVPGDFKKKMVNAFSYEKCKNSAYYDFDYHNNLNLKVDRPLVPIHRAFTDMDKKYLKRLVTMNLLEEFGFTDDMRKEIDITVGTGAAAQTVKKKPEKPKTDKLDDFTHIPDDHILNEDCWKNYIKSLSGIPALGRDETTIGAAIKEALDDAKNNLMFWKGLGERSTWSAGSNGRIMFGVGDKTFAMNGPGEGSEIPQFLKVNGMSSSVMSLSDADFKGYAAEEQAIQNFVEQIRKELLSY